MNRRTSRPPRRVRSLRRQLRRLTGLEESLGWLAITKYEIRATIFEPIFGAIVQFGNEENSPVIRGLLRFNAPATTKLEFHWRAKPRKRCGRAAKTQFNHE